MNWCEFLETETEGTLQVWRWLVFVRTLYPPCLRVSISSVPYLCSTSDASEQAAKASYSQLLIQARLHCSFEDAVPKDVSNIWILECENGVLRGPTHGFSPGLPHYWFRARQQQRRRDAGGDG